MKYITSQGPKKSLRQLFISKNKNEIYRRFEGGDFSHDELLNILRDMWLNQNGLNPKDHFYGIVLPIIEELRNSREWMVETEKDHFVDSMPYEIKNFADLCAHAVNSLLLDYSKPREWIYHQIEGSDRLQVMYPYSDLFESYRRESLGCLDPLSNNPEHPLASAMKVVLESSCLMGVHNYFKYKLKEIFTPFPEMYDLVLNSIAQEYVKTYTAQLGSVNQRELMAKMKKDIIFDFEAGFSNECGHYQYPYDCPSAFYRHWDATKDERQQEAIKVLNKVLHLMGQAEVIDLADWADQNDVSDQDDLALDNELSAFLEAVEAATNDLLKFMASLETSKKQESIDPPELSGPPLILTNYNAKLEQEKDAFPSVHQKSADENAPDIDIEPPVLIPSNPSIERRRF